MTPTPAAEGGLEQRFATLQRAADELLGQLDVGKKAATRLRKGAVVGDMNSIRKALDDLAALTRQVETASTAVVDATPSDAELRSALGPRFLAEVEGIGRSEGLSISELDGRLIAFPVIIETNPDSLTVKLGRKTTRNLRPSAIVAQIRIAMRKARSKPDRFIELLYSAALWVNAENARTSGVRLDDVYKVLTLHPDTKKTYSPTDFAADLYTLDTSTVKATRKGAQLAFLGATGAKGASGTFTIIGTDSLPRHYVGIRFEEEQR